MREIENRKDVNDLVVTFYSKVRQDDLIGPIFNKIIPEEKWPIHLEKLTDFWETNLFGVVKFKGNPVAVHRDVDEKVNFSIDQVHFGRWLELWFQTINALFTGDLADKAKQSARKMATGQFIAMWNVRPVNL